MKHELQENISRCQEEKSCSGQQSSCNINYHGIRYSWGVGRNYAPGGSHSKREQKSSVVIGWVVRSKGKSVKIVTPIFQQT